MLSKVLLFLQVFSDDEFSTDFSASVDEAEDLPKTYCNFWIDQLVFVLCFLPFECVSRALTPIDATSICLLQKLHLAVFNEFFFNHDLYLGFNNHRLLKVDFEFFLFIF